MSNTVTTSALGVAFWGVASRTYTSAELGQDAALISAMVLLSTVSQLNLSMGIPRLLPQVRARRWRPVLGAYAVTALLAAGLTGCFVYFAPRISTGYAFLGQDRALGLALVLAVVLWNIFALQDAVLTSARWAVAIPFENAFFGLLKIALMVWLSRGFVGNGIFVAWVLAMALLVVPVNGLIFWKVLPSSGRGDEPKPETALPLRRRDRVARYLLTDYVAALLSQGSTALLPVLVVGVLGSTGNAYFYLAFLVAAAVGALAHSLSVSLLVEGAHDASEVASLARRSLVRYIKWVGPAVGLLIIAAPLVLAPFGAGYVTNSTGLLRLLLAGTVPQAVVTIYLGVERVRGNVTRVLAVEAVTVALVVAGALIGMRWYGLAGVGLAWLVAQGGMAVAVAPRLWKVIGDHGERPDTVAMITDDGSAASTPHVRVAAAAPPFPSLEDLVDVGAALVAATLLLLVGIGSAGTARLALALVFVTFVPGWAVLDYVPLALGASRLALAVALSLSLTAAASLSSLWLHLWQPRILFDVTGAASLVAVLWHLGRPRGPARRRNASVTPIPDETSGAWS